VHGKISLPVTVEIEGSQHTGPATGSLKIPVDTGSPWLMTTRGRPTLTETSFMSDRIRIPVPLTNTRRGGDTRRQDHGALSSMP
jgi:hypothetical protein